MKRIRLLLFAAISAMTMFMSACPWLFPPGGGPEVPPPPL